MKLTSRPFVQYNPVLSHPTALGSKRKCIRVGSDQMALASFNLEINSSTESTLIPAARDGGSSTLSVSNSLAISTPKSDAFNFSNGFFLAFMMLGNDAYLGSFNLKSVVMIMGNDALKVSAPPSTSSVTSTLSPSISTFDAFVACGQFNNPANI